MRSSLILDQSLIGASAGGWKMVNSAPPSPAEPTTSTGSKTYCTFTPHSGKLKGLKNHRIPSQTQTSQTVRTEAI